MLKAGWSLCHRSNGWWVKTIKSKYRRGSDIVPTIRPGSNSWQGICKGWPNKNIIWRVGET